MLAFSNLPRQQLDNRAFSVAGPVAWNQGLHKNISDIRYTVWYFRGKISWYL